MFEPRSGQPPGTPQPASSRKAIQRDTAYDDHPDCAVLPAVKPPGANPTNASSPMPTPSSGPRRPGRTGGGVTLEQGPSTPLGPRHLTGAEGARGGGPRWGRVGDLPGGGGRPPPRGTYPPPIYIHFRTSVDACILIRTLKQHISPKNNKLEKLTHTNIR